MAMCILRSGVPALMIGATIMVSAAAHLDGAPRAQTRAANPAQAAASPELSADVVRDVARVRAATEPFQSLDRAVAAGYSRDGGECVAHPSHGAMGFHHQQSALVDARLDVERPEILVYERLADGVYRLTGVEYVVPFAVWPETTAPPTIMGQPLKPARALGIWYRHVWVWRENPAGLFADWHPQVKC
jgi:hypothetical protein